MPRIRLCTLKEAPKPNQGMHFDVGDGPGIALFNADGTFYATEDNCPHMHAPLHDGIVARGVVTCLWHSWQFELDTGDSLMSEHICLKTWPVSIEDGAIYVEHD